VASIKWPLDKDKDARPVVVFFEDEGRFGRISREMYCWVRKDMVPSVARQMVREYIYAYSALSPQTGDCYSIITPSCNTESMNYFLKRLAGKYKQYNIVLILDKAGWHISNNISLPDNLVLLHLPPYSPELNPVELLWREVRRNFFHNKIFNSLDEVEDTLAEALREWHKKPEKVKSLANGFSYFNIIDGG